MREGDEFSEEEALEGSKKNKKEKMYSIRWNRS